MLNLVIEFEYFTEPDTKSFQLALLRQAQTMAITNTTADRRHL